MHSPAGGKYPNHVRPSMARTLDRSKTMFSGSGAAIGADRYRLG